MQVLLYVMTILMMLIIMTYGRLESFKNLAGAQGAFTGYMEKIERDYQNRVEQELYTKIVATPKEKEEKQKAKASPGSPKINFAYIVIENMREQHQSLYHQYLLVSKNLIHFLYQDKPFYQEMLQKNPNFLTELFTSLIAAAADANIQKAKDLATLDLKNPDLQMVWYKMLDGTPDTIDEFENFKKVVGYESLLDFITIDKKREIRIFLASPQVLMALFGNPTTVLEILDERNRLYKEVTKQENPLDLKEASEIFKGLFEERRLPGIENRFLDFSVSKTYPKKYEKKNGK